MSSNVYVIQEVPGRNLTSLSQWGVPKVCLGSNVQVALVSEPTVRRLREQLKHFTDADFLVPIGDPAAIGIACALAAQYNGGRFKMLKWDRLDRRYYEVRINLSGAPAIPKTVI